MFRAANPIADSIVRRDCDDRSDIITRANHCTIYPNYGTIKLFNYQTT